VARRKKGQKQVEALANKLERLAIEYVPIDSIEPNEYNPNRQSERDFELLLKSMRDDGFTQPVIVHRPTRRIVDGEHRWRAAAELGYPELPVVFVDMTPEQMRVSTLRHNRARGSEDIELTAQLLRDLRELGALDFAQDALLMDDVELQRMLDDIPVPEMLMGEEFNDAWEPESAEAATMRLGDDAEVGLNRDVDVSDHASSKLREMEKKISKAKSEEEKAAIKRDTNVFRLVLVLDGPEAEVVKEILGDERAAALIALCRAEKARRDEAAA